MLADPLTKHFTKNEKNPLKEAMKRGTIRVGLDKEKHAKLCRNLRKQAQRASRLKWLKNAYMSKSERNGRFNAYYVRKI